MTNKENINYKKASLKHIKSLSPIWILPILTICIGIWISFDLYSKRGYHITFIANDASTLIEEKTPIKNKNVTIGTVERISLSDDFDKVSIKARIKKEAFPLINDSSVFWIVKPEITKDGVSGLSTLISGSYIEVSSNAQDTPDHQTKSEFTLFTSKPFSLEENNTNTFYLETDTNGNILNKGSKIIYKGIAVGYVDDIKLNNDNSRTYKILIDEQYNKLINSDTIFWINSGVNLNVSTTGLDLNISSIDQLLSPVIEFDVFKSNSKDNQAPKYLQKYKLFNSAAEGKRNIYKNSKLFVLFFDGNVAGLSNTSLVTFRGLTIGRVVEIPYNKLLKSMSLSARIPVLINIEPERITGLGSDNTEFLASLVSAQKQGLRASIDSPNLLTGASNITLNFDKNSVNSTTILQQYDGIDELLAINSSNSLSNQLTALTNSTTEFLNKLNKLPLENTMSQVNKTLRSYQEGSDFYNNLNNNLINLEKTLNEVTPLLKTLNKKSNSLIFPPREVKDPIPKGINNK